MPWWSLFLIGNINLSGIKARFIVLNEHKKQHVCQQDWTMCSIYWHNLKFNSKHKWEACLYDWLKGKKEINSTLTSYNSFHLISNSETWNHNVPDLQLLNRWDHFWSDPTARTACEVVNQRFACMMEISEQTRFPQFRLTKLKTRIRKPTSSLKLIMVLSE
jgi:hypothetical protein